MKHVLCCIYVFFTLFGYLVRAGGCPKGLVHNVRVHFFTLGSSKMQVYETYFFDTMITQNNHPRHVKHVLGRISVFFTLFAYWAHGRVGGGWGSQGIGAQPASGVFHPRFLKNGSF